MFTTICDAEDATSSIEAMRQQEEKGYNTSDYFQAHQGEDQAEPCFRSKGPLRCEDPVDENCRFRMTEWCFQVVDVCKYDRETVEIAISYLDRFLATPKGADVLKDRKVFQLAAMTCLYTAIKIHEPEAMEPQVVSRLSRGTYSAEDVEAMERMIITAIQWRMNPPTAMSFVRFFMALLPVGAMEEEDRTAAVELAKYQTELAVGEYSFVGVNASTIACAALANALQTLENVELKHSILENVSCTVNIDMNSLLFVTTQESLWTAMGKENRSHQRQLMPQSPAMQKTMERSSAIHGSPRGVISQQ